MPNNAVNPEPSRFDKLSVAEGMSVLFCANNIRKTRHSTNPKARTLGWFSRNCVDDCDGISGSNRCDAFASLICPYNRKRNQELVPVQKNSTIIDAEWSTIHLNRVSVMSEFKGKVVIITGSSMGIGKTVARQLLEAGASVVINGRNQERLDATALQFRSQGFDPLPIAADVSNVDDARLLAQRTLDHFGRIDILINNAGVSMEGELDDLNPDVFRKVIDVNLLGSVNATQGVLPAIRKSGGSVLFISSVAGLSGLPGFSAYSCSKMALTALAQSLRTELHGEGVHVGIAYVGFTQNDPDKQIHNAQGELIPQPARDFASAQPVDVVAQRIIQMVERRQFKRVFSPLGKLAAITNWWSPPLLSWFIRHMYARYELAKTFQTGIAGAIENAELRIAR